LAEAPGSRASGLWIAMTQFLSYAAAVWWSLAAFVLGATIACGLAQPFVQRRRAARKDQPPVSAIMPVKLLNPGFETAQASLFAQNYPSYEVLISAAEEESPALQAASRIAAAHPGISSRFFRSSGMAAVSPKLNNLAAPLAAARHDLILTKDSNITLDPGGMAAFVQNLTEDVGLVVAVPVAVRAKNLAGEIEACLLNGHARLLLSASVVGLGFGVGKAALFRQSDLARGGGFEAISHMLAEDTALSMLLARQGLKTVFSHHTVAQEIGPRSFVEIYGRQLRWSVIRRKNERFTYPLEPLASPLPAALAGALAAPLVSCPASLGFALTLLVWFCAETGFALCKGWEVPARFPLAFLGREILALTSWLHAFATHEVEWGNARFDARQGARAVPGEPPAFENHQNDERGAGVCALPAPRHEGEVISQPAPHSHAPKVTTFSFTAGCRNKHRAGLEG
jgi:ceramide glucosyltransferase